MALYIPHSIFHLARLLYVRPETFGPYYVHVGFVLDKVALKHVLLLILSFRPVSIIHQ